jgi:ammonium transporter, Amt family
VLSAVGTMVLLFLVDKTIGLRVPAEDEMEGLDLSQHGEEGYDLNS